MVKTVLYAEKLYDSDKVEREVFGSDVRVVWRNVTNLSQLEERDCAEVDGLMVLRHAVTAEHLAKFPRLACVVRMGVGYDKIDRQAAAAAQGPGLQRAGLRHHRGRRPRDGARPVAAPRHRCCTTRRSGRPRPRRGAHVRDPLIQRIGRADLRHRRPRPHRHGGRAAGQGVPFPRRRSTTPICRTASSSALGIDRAATLEDLLRADRHAVDPCAADAGDTRHARRGAAASCCRRAAWWSTRRAGRSSTSTRWPTSCARAYRRRRARRPAGGAAGRADPRAAARLPRARTVVRGAAGHHAALRLVHAAVVGRHPAQVGRNDARGAAWTAAAERHHAGDVLRAGQAVAVQ